MQSSRIPAIYIAKYNRFVDNILGRINRILGKSYDPVRVKLQTSESTSNKKKNNSNKRKSGSKKKKSSTRTVPQAANKMGDVEIARRKSRSGFVIPENIQREVSRAFNEEFGDSGGDFRVFRDPEGEAREVAFRAVARAEEMARIAKNVAKLREKVEAEKEEFSKSTRPVETKLAGLTTSQSEELVKLIGSPTTESLEKLVEYSEQPANSNEHSSSTKPTTTTDETEKTQFPPTESREFKNLNERFFELSRATESEEPSFILISKNTDLGSAVPIKNVTLEVRANPSGGKKKKNNKTSNQRKNNKNKGGKTKKGNQTKQNNKQSSSSGSKARATLFGLSTLRREGDVVVSTLNDYTNVRTNFVLGPLTLRVEKEFGKGSKRQLKSATATTAEMFGKLNLKIVHGGAATLQSIKVLQPKQVRVDSADNHEKTKQYMWQRSSHIASVVSRKLASAARSMLKPPPHS